MQTNLQKIQEKKFLFAVLILIASANLLSNFLGIETAILVGNFSYVPISIGLVVVSLVTLKKFGTSGNHGFSWISLTGFSISWFLAEMTWIYQEVFLKIDPFPSISDVFYLVGYPFLLMFLFSYLQPFRNGISKKMISYSIAISLAILIPSLFLSVQIDSEISLFDSVFALAYPVADAIIIIPALIGISLFFKGQVNFMWTLVCLGILSVFVADTTFVFTQFDQTYYTGHPLEILFQWTYVLIGFGVYDQLSIFQKRIFSKKKEFSE